MSLEVDVVESAGKKMVMLKGRLDTNTTPELEAQLAPVLESKPTVLVFDLADLEYISSAGLRAIFKARKAQREADARTLLVNIQPQVKKVFDIVKAIPDASIFRNVEELDAYLDTFQRKEGD
jgi:anti-anti-sigma factor